MRYTFASLIQRLVGYPHLGLNGLNTIFRASGKTKSEGLPGGLVSIAQAGF